MRAVLIGFALGVAMLQQRAALLARWEWVTLGVLFTGALAVIVGSRPSLSMSARPSRPVRVTGALRWAEQYAAYVAMAGAAFIAGFAYAALRAEARLGEALPAAWELRDIPLTGYVRGLPIDDRGSVRFLFVVDADEARLSTGIERFPSVIQLSWRARGPRATLPSLRPGDRWRLTVRLKRPHGYANFAGHDMEASWFERGVRATGSVVDSSSAVRLPGSSGGVGTLIDRLRLTVRERMARALGRAAHAGIVTALAIGTQEAIAATDRLALRRTGTSHLVAVSGLHIGFVAGLGAALTAWLWRRSCFFGGLLAARGAREWPLVLPTPIVAAIAGVACATGYAALAGFNIPAQRALWMLIVASLAFVLGRSVGVSLVLAWALALVLAVDPWAVTAAGFWLSFGAVALIAYAMRARLRVRSDEQAPLDMLDMIRASDSAWTASAQEQASDGPRLRGLPWRRWLANGRLRCLDALRAQWAVTIGLAPLTAFWFSQVSLVGPLANAFAVPWVSLLVVPIVLVGMVLPAPLDALAYEGAHALLEPLMRALHALAQSPWADRHPPQPSLWALAFALIGVAWCLAPRGWPLRFAAPLAWLPLLAPSAPEIEHGAFRVTALDVGQGSSILIQTRHRALLFDAGTGPESTDAGDRIVAPFLLANGVPRIDALVVSHGDADHAGGVPAVLAAVDVGQLLGGLPPAHRLWDMARSSGIDRLRCAAGQRWQWDGVWFEMLWPDPGPLPTVSNEQSCVLRVSAPGMRALLTGDIGAASERTLARRFREALSADILLVPHHGSATSSTEPFLDWVHPRVWSRFAERDIALARTDRDGALRVELIDGQLSLERYRQTHARYWMDRQD